MKDKPTTKLIFDGVCPCGGHIKTSEWKTKTMFCGRSTCRSCGKSDYKEELRREV